jgi:hypothetical protein
MPELRTEELRVGASLRAWKPRCQGSRSFSTMTGLGHVCTTSTSSAKVRSLPRARSPPRPTLNLSNSGTSEWFERALDRAGPCRRLAYHCCREMPGDAPEVRASCSAPHSGERQTGHGESERDCTNQCARRRRRASRRHCLSGVHLRHARARRRTHWWSCFQQRTRPCHVAG